MKKLLLMPVLISLVFVSIIGGAAQQVIAKEIVIKAVSFLPPNAKNMKTYGMYIDMVNQRAKGELVIKWVGGPEVVPRLDQAPAVSDGVVDMTATPASYYPSLIPTATPVCILSQVTPMEEHKNGIYDFLVKEHAEKNLRFLGRFETYMTFHAGIKTKINGPQDFKGKKIRSLGLYEYFITAMGAIPVNVPHAEVYTALERGVIDGYMGPFTNDADYSLFEACKYFIDHTFYEAGNTVMIMNLKKWNSLPQNLQKLMIDAVMDLEPKLSEIYTKDQGEARQKIIDNGMVPIKFSPEDAKTYRDLAYTSFREGYKKLLSPEKYAEIVRLTTP